MRLWSIHPKYLDPQGLVALWREGLLAKKVLEGNTKGYKNHPQLERFKKSPDPILFINYYLHFVVQEALERKYSFDGSKIMSSFPKINPLPVTQGQLTYEFEHLKNKFKKRDKKLFEKIKHTKDVEVHPLFTPIDGEVETWEKI
jgi:hypothetical protein